jgi:gliding motility-associated-like protein
MRFIAIAFLFLLFSISTGYAQVCTGSLGDAIINVDFGSGTSLTGPPLVSGTTTYTYTTGTPSDGQYSIARSTNGMYPSSWWQVTDHTGNANGYMMVVNASLAADNFYTQTISGLCPGTTYEFAAWVMNLIKTSGINPNITFTISNSSGTIKTFSTGSIPISSSATWKQYGTFFTTPAAGGPITLTMSNNAPGGNGNDIVLDDITFKPCGPNITSSFSSTTSANINACAGSNASYTMSASISGSSYVVPMYQWQTYKNGAWANIAGAVTTTYQANFIPAVAGTYQYRLASADGGNIASTTCRVVSNILTVNINTPVTPTINGTAAICEGEAISLTASSGDSYSWTGPGGYTSSLQNLVINNATPANSGTYNLTVNTLGCSTNASKDVMVNPKVIASAGSDITICKGSSTVLHATGGSTYQWLPVTGLSDPTSANPVATPQDTIAYTVTVTSAANCSATATVSVNVVQMPVVNAGVDRKMTDGQSITLAGNAKGNGITYYWTPSLYLSDPNLLNPVAKPTEDITYTLHALNNSCNFEVTDDVFIRVYKKVVVPNTFTPNNDGVNDTWAITALETYPESLTQVYNRNGQLVYKSQGYDKAWDGKYRGSPLPEGTYYYTIQLKKGTILSGSISIIR